MSEQVFTMVDANQLDISDVDYYATNTTQLSELTSNTFKDLMYSLFEGKLIFDRVLN